MKMTPQQLDEYYESQGIRASDLLSAEPLALTALPECVLSDKQTSVVSEFVGLWNEATDPRVKIDMTHAMERRALGSHKGRGTDPTAEAWAAYLMLGRVRGCEYRRDWMQTVARGEVEPSYVRNRKTRARTVRSAS